MVRKRIKDKEYELVNTNFNIHDCHACVFGNNGSCSLDEIYTMCNSTNRTHWEEIKNDNTDMKKTYKAKDCANNKRNAMESKRTKNGDTFNFVPTLSDSDCDVCVFYNKEQCQCSLRCHDTTISAKEKDEMFKMCRNTPRMHWEKENKEAEIHNLTVGATPTMNIGDTIKLNGYIYRLDKCVPHSDNETKCSQCIFGAKGRCCLRDDDNTLKDRADELITNCEREIAVYKFIKVDDLKIIEADYSDGNSSTGVVNPSTDDAPKEPKGLDKYTTRRFTKEVTLEEARNWFHSHNELLRDFATRIFTPAELEDVRKCTMNVDIKTAKRLYRNAENVVRDFVLSAFSEEELKD